MTLLRKSRSIAGRGLFAFLFSASIYFEVGAQTGAPATGDVTGGPVETQRSPALEQRVPRQPPSISALQGRLIDSAGQPLGRFSILLSATAGACAPAQKLCAVSDADGIFRILQVPAGDYPLTFRLRDEASFQREKVHIGTGEVLSIQVQLPVTQAPGASSVIPRAAAEINDSYYRELSRHGINAKVFKRRIASGAGVGGGAG